MGVIFSTCRRTCSVSHHNENVRANEVRRAPEPEQPESRGVRESKSGKRGRKDLGPVQRLGRASSTQGDASPHASDGSTSQEVPLNTIDQSNTVGSQPPRLQLLDPGADPADLLEFSEEQLACMEIIDRHEAEARAGLAGVNEANRRSTRRQTAMIIENTLALKRINEGLDKHFKEIQPIKESIKAAAAETKAGLDELEEEINQLEKRFG